jgi:hypothetical protein
MLRSIVVTNGTAILTTDGLVFVENLTKRHTFRAGSGNLVSPFFVESFGQADCRLWSLHGHGLPFLLPDKSGVAYMDGDDGIKFMNGMLTPDMTPAFFRPNKTWHVFNGVDDDENLSFEESLATLNTSNDAKVLRSIFAHLNLEDDKLIIDSGNPLCNRAMVPVISAYGVQVTLNDDFTLQLARDGAACWPSKLLINLFNGSDALKVIGDFYARGIFKTNRLISPALICLAANLRTPMEGYVIENLSVVDRVAHKSVRRDCTLVTLPSSVLLPTMLFQM